MQAQAAVAGLGLDRYGDTTGHRGGREVPRRPDRGHHRLGEPPQGQRIVAVGGHGTDGVGGDRRGVVQQPTGDDRGGRQLDPAGQGLQGADPGQVVGGGTDAAQPLDQRGHLGDPVAGEQRVDPRQPGEVEPRLPHRPVRSALHDDLCPERVDDLVEHPMLGHG
ncbi:hypothetical protein SDC9_142998 [bioreactor metagenome]|uniref:Uncharacterized protein n=1 Tax=bioreactor metagenome TaxID=1076179 RepID=A0A645E4W0_9ZZZZ